MKKLTLIMLISLLLTTYSFGYELKAIKVYLNDIELKLEVEPIIVNERTMLSFNDIFGIFGLEHNWNDDKQILTGRNEKVEITFQVNSKIMNIYDKNIQMELPVIIKNDRVMLPLRVVAENLGATVDWNHNQRRINIIYRSESISSETKTDKDDKNSYDEVLKSIEKPSTDNIHDSICANVKNVGGDLLLSNVIKTKEYLEPLFWASEKASTSDKNNLIGSLPVPGWAGKYGKGRVMVYAGHDEMFSSKLDGDLDNDILRENMMKWLLDGKKRMAFSTSHNEILGIRKFSEHISNYLESNGVKISTINSYTGSALLETDLLFIGGPYKRYAEDELKAMEKWVRNGGSLFVIGLGWSWAKYQKDPRCDNAPINQLGGIFGWKACEGIIFDPLAPNGNFSYPSFKIEKLTEYRPKKTVVLKKGTSEFGDLKQIINNDPEQIYVMEGDYIALNISNADWMYSNDPAKIISTLDNVFRTQLEFCNVSELPKNGEKFWIVPINNDKASYYMYAGNPTVIQNYAGRHIVDSINSKGYPGWGIIHEFGHDMGIFLCSQLFIANGTGEGWANVVNMWTHEKLGWLSEVNTKYFEDGYKYHTKPNPNFSELLKSDWIFLGCMKLIWDKYGWEGMHNFFSQATRDAQKGMYIENDNEKTQYMVKNLSHGYSVDFSDLFEHWGFKVDNDTKLVLKKYTKAAIAW